MCFRWQGPQGNAGRWGNSAAPRDVAAFTKASTSRCLWDRTGRRGDRQVREVGYDPILYGNYLLSTGSANTQLHVRPYGEARRSTRRKGLGGERLTTEGASWRRGRPLRSRRRRQSRRRRPVAPPGRGDAALMAMTTVAGLSSFAILAVSSRRPRCADPGRPRLSGTSVSAYWYCAAPSPRASSAPRRPPQTDRDRIRAALRGRELTPAPADEPPPPVWWLIGRRSIGGSRESHGTRARKSREAAQRSDGRREMTRGVRLPTLGSSVASSFALAAIYADKLRTHRPDLSWIRDFSRLP